MYGKEDEESLERKNFTVFKVVTCLTCIWSPNSYLTASDTKSRESITAQLTSVSTYRKIVPNLVNSRRL